MKEYTIKKVTGKPENWESIPKALIDTYKWMDNGYTPKVEAAICYDEKAMYIKFWAYETEVRGEHHTHQESVCEDSCVEFFFRPNSDPNFFNIETNVLGTQKIGFGPKRGDRATVEVVEADMQITPSVTDAETYCGEVWTVEYRVPFSLTRKYYGELDILKDGLRANLFKCGDCTKFEHYGMWSPVEVPEPDFHVPAFFGKMTFEK